MIFIGIDLHSNCFSVHIIYSNGRKRNLSFSLNEESLREFYTYLNKKTYVLIEASTNTFSFVDLIKSRVKAAYVANPYKMRLISFAGKKTDRVDAEKLAVFLKMQISSGETLIDPVYIPEKGIQELRSFFSTYKLLRKQVTSLKNRIHSILKQNLHPFTKQYIFGKRRRREILSLEMPNWSHFQLEMLFSDLDYIEARIRELEDKIMLSGSEYLNEIDILTSMKGISVFTAIAIISDMATVSRFPNSKHFASYMRSAPVVDSSNETTRIKSTTKRGRKLSITLITQSLNHFRDSNPKLNRWYNKKLSHKSRGKIRMALCRRVFSEIYQMLKKGEYHHYRDEVNHKNKMEAYYKFLNKNGVAGEKVA